MAMARLFLIKSRLPLKGNPGSPASSNIKKPFDSLPVPNGQATGGTFMAENATESDFGQGGFPRQDRTGVNPSDEAIRIGPLVIRFLLSGSDSNGSVSVFELLVPAGQKLPAPPHKNDGYEETLYGIEGVVTWTVDGMPIEVGPGQALCIPRGAAHRFDNLGGRDAKQLVVLTPAIMGAAYFREAAEVINAAVGSPPDREKMTEIMRRHGMTVSAPSPSK